jgi:hypothetical protein
LTELSESPACIGMFSLHSVRYDSAIHIGTE